MEDNRIFEKEPQWEQDGELRRIRKTIRRRNRKNICVSVLLAVCLKPMLLMLGGSFAFALLSVMLELLDEKYAARALDQLSGVCKMTLSLCTSAMAIWIILIGATLSLGRGL